MLKFKSLILNIVSLFHTVKEENLQWHQKNEAGQTRLKQARVLAEKELEAELKKRGMQLMHDLTLLKTKHETELSIFKTRCKQDIIDYKQYLKSLDQLKDSIQNQYPKLPQALAFTIHHHAKYLLHNIWETDDLEQKMFREMQLINFMTTLHADASAYHSGENAGLLPENTLRLLELQQITGKPRL